MTKEELREGIEHLLATFTGEGDFTTELLDYLHSVGVVIKADYTVKYSTAIPAGTELAAVESLI